MKSKVYDCFCFFNELDILELRLNILDPYVDYFVLSEANVTHVGTSKPYYFEENKDRFSKFMDKIIHLKIEDTPHDFTSLSTIENPESYDDGELNKIYRFIETQTERFNVRTQPDYGRDFFQKECVRRGLENCNDDDIIIFSDVDEIPNPHRLKDLSDLDQSAHYTFNQNFYCYYLNVLKEKNWLGSRAARFSQLRDYSYNELRASPNTIIEDGGWHFSFMGGPDEVYKKLTSYSAAHLANSVVLGSVIQNINNNIDPFFRGRLETLPLDNSFPEYLLQNRDKYRHLIKDG